MIINWDDPSVPAGALAVTNELPNTPVAPMHQPWPPEMLTPHDGVFMHLARRVLAPSPDNLTGLELETQVGFLRMYDLGMLAWIEFWAKAGNLQVPVLQSVVGSAFSEYYNRIRDIPPQTGNPEYKCLPNNPLSFPLPLISFSNLGYTPSATGRNDSMPIRLIKYLNPDKTRSAWTRFPSPVDINYQIDIWTRKRSHLSWLVHRFETQWVAGRSYWYVNAPHNDRILMPVKRNGGGEDLSARERDEQSDALHRYTFNVVVEGRVFHDWIVAPVITQVQQDYYVPVEELVGTTTYTAPDPSPDG